MNRTAQRGFTLVELVVTVAVIAVLLTLTLQGVGQVRTAAQGAYCANSLRQLGAATALYLGDHHNKMFAYQAPAPGGTLWYYGYESGQSLGSAEGARTVDMTQSPLYPYVQQAGGVHVCPSFPYNQAIWKPKYSGASWGYGFDVPLSNANVSNIPHPSQTLLFGDCAQVNTFEAPASAKHPMLEEFYMFDYSDKTTHFRHGGYANILFLDGHVEKFTMYPGTQDMNLPSANVGRFTPPNSWQYLQQPVQTAQ
jgi:prepilin-type processing-associated H-X9-DG protein/prepilin-type N-terminal cleavage/methylation domain-containing protein